MAPSGLVRTIVGALSGGLPSAVSGGLSGSLMILCVLPLESIMSFQTAGKVEGQAKPVRR